MAANADVNPDLAKERQSATFNPDELTYIIDGSSAKTKRRRHIEHIFRTDPVFDGPDNHFLSREASFLEGERKHVALFKKIKELQLTDSEDILYATAASLPDGRGSFSMHSVAFAPPIRLLGDEAQKNYWLKKADNFEIIGAYAQTELGHGSYVRGIETRADFDPKTKEFVLNSPTTSSIKWWAGSLGLAATHVLVMAQLWTNGKSHGLHPFIVQVRDLDTHSPLPGIEVGDIGPKFGFATVDNGYMKLTNVRIPRDHLLKKTGQVLDDGTYVKPQSTKLVYGGMLGIRASLPRVGAVNLARAVTIAIRYSCVRRQSEIKPGEPEPQVLDFQTQQHKLLPLLAGAYAYTFVSQWMLDLHRNVVEELNKGDFSRLPEDHISAAGLKALVNWKVHEGVELCRLSCGGHGYSLASGLPSIYSNHVANSTAEGETTVLLLQTAKYLGKRYMDLQQGKALEPSLQYLAQKNFGSADFSRGVDIRSLLRAFQFKSFKVLERVGTKLQKVLMETGDQHAALNSNLVGLTDVAKAHTEVLIMNAFVEKVESLSKTNTKLVPVLTNLCQIYGITEILASAGVFLQEQYLTKSQLDWLQDELFVLYTKIRPEAVALVDAFDFSDQTLASILGRYDGQVYDNLYQWAKNSPLNKDEVHESFKKYLQPLKQSSKL